MNAEFWAGKKVFITGHTGFKGGWLALWLNSIGATVKGYALEPSTEPSLFELARVDKACESQIDDIRDRQALARSMAAFKPDVVFHLAAQPLVRLSYDEPVTTFETNVLGTVNLLEAVRGCSSVKAVVIVTSDKCYLNREWHWGYREHESLGGHDPYSASKACAELVTQAWRLSYLGAGGQDGRVCSIATARAGNVIGGGDWSADRLVPDILRDLADKKSIVVRNPQAIRPWQHVLEPLAGYLMLAERLVVDGEPWADSWNFGPREDSAKTVEWIVDALIRYWPGGGQWQHDGSRQPHEAHYLKLDCAKANDRLGWQPVWSLDESLEKIVHWQTAWLAGADMQAHSMQEIAEFRADAGSLLRNPVMSGGTPAAQAANATASSMDGEPV